MPEGTKVWAVSSGAYSDYGVLAVFSSKENADRYCAALLSEGAHGYGAPFVEDFDLDPPTTVLREGLDYFYVGIDQDGNAEVLEFKPEEDQRHGYEYRNGRAVRLCKVLIAKDATGAIKAMNELRARLVATNRWGLYGEA